MLKYFGIYILKTDFSAIHPNILFKKRKWLRRSEFVSLKSPTIMASKIAIGQ